MKKIFCAFCISAFAIAACGQRPFDPRAMIVITPSPYSLQDELVLVNGRSSAKLTLAVDEIEVIDNRYDTSKQGFFPVMKNAPRQIKFNDNLARWFKDQFSGIIESQGNSGRRLVVVIQHFWFSNFADQKFNPFHQHLETSLNFRIDFFSFNGQSYFPLRKSEGSFNSVFENTDTYQPLIDSLFKKLAGDLTTISFPVKEAVANAISPDRLKESLERKQQKPVVSKPLVKGVYASFDDFLDRRIISDSVDLFKYNDFFDRQMVACHVGVYIDNALQPGNRYWGYSDGRFLFVNTGNGLFVKLTPWFRQFVFADLQQIAFTKKRKSFINEAMIGNTSFEILKSFAKAYHLFYQLDFDNGSLN